jgi:hypothetical protein
MSINEARKARSYTGLIVAHSTIPRSPAMLNETLVAAFLAILTPAPAKAADTPSAPAVTVQKKAMAQDRIYGSQLMTAEERNVYRDRMKQAKTPAERDRIREAHHGEMQQRAKERGVTLPEQPRSRATGTGRSGEGRGPRGGAGG